MWIVLEVSNAELILPCMNEDGTTKVFDVYADAEEERDGCQEGLIVPIGGIGRRRIEALTEVKRVHPDELFDAWSLADLEKTCSDLKRLGKVGAACAT